MVAPQLNLDANLAVLFVVGQTNRDYIAKHKRLSAYDAIDYDIVCRLIALYSGVFFTPNTLSETSNLIRFLADPMRSEVSLVFAEIVRRVDERFVASRIAVEHPQHVRLGLTDAALLTAAIDGGTLLTADLDLYLAACRVGLHAINYNHIRDELRDDFK